MSRKMLVNIHLVLAAFFAPVVFLVSVSGGLYLLGIKGNFHQQSVFAATGRTLDPDSPTLEAEVKALLTEAGVEARFGYLKASDGRIQTRPTSRTNYLLKYDHDSVEILRQTPDLQMRLIELHKGHGPLAFKTFQKITAVGLFLIVLIGLWIGLASRPLRGRAIAVMGAGIGVFVLLASGV